ncbi:MAG TPA: DEAD/DEAH box helicase [Bacteroidales bacterium]|nr:DEAD/DEAH box helicase [Bacteroidales bacterium]
MKTKFKMDKENKEFNFAHEVVNEYNRNLFLTGRAGTGKTTFLKYQKKKSNKKMIIVAPTGVSAINAGGVTINSFFQIPYTPFPPNDIRLQPETYIKKDNIFKSFIFNKEKLQIIKNLELLIIDEISMVRCDTMDVIDSILRHFRNSDEPFGGVQVLMIGDPYQLSPIVKKEEWDILKKHYKSPYFFSSKVITRCDYIYLELKKIYRQKDLKFIKLLNCVRENIMTENELFTLNSRNNLNYKGDLNKYIFLGTHNKQVDEINQNELNNIDSEQFCYDAEINGEIDNGSITAPHKLCLKVGARVMFLKNDNSENQYYNGKLGNIIELNDEKIIVICDDGIKVNVKKSRWENFQYSFDDKKGKVIEETKGTFLQYPLKLAWAITIHKSQGLTFEKVIADLNDAFAEGQVYVALSRCTSLEGLILKSKIKSSNIKLSKEVVEFGKVKEGRIQV